ncbi:MAG: biotin--[acetyl-CoA-carboxylase] ligase [Candidatus Symbiothrix sp.]|jgi:BirA family biotin operon repressor/biotin-[acetyl-CoA-carboxylase] ligase|nr:biotin--[acetyl-CoA-carboxylase] ligase [Candidatus Symbiothrix sp.]
MHIIHIQSTDSTNRQLKQLSDEQPLPEGTVLVACEQTSGRGQAGNTWEAEAGKNLTFSMLLYPTFLSPKQHFLLSEAVALALTEALSTGVIAGLSIKWPNDIYVGERKIAGILIENDWQDNHIQRSIVGIGLNVNQEIFRSDAPNPVSIKQITGQDTDLDALLNEISNHIYKVYEQLKQYCADEGDRKGSDEGDRKGRPFYAQNLYHGNGFFDYEDKNGRFRAQIQSVSDDGLLHLETDQGERRSYAFKEVKQIPACTPVETHIKTNIHENKKVSGRMAQNWYSSHH